MVQYACDFCGKVKGPRDNWVLGIAAETVSPTSAHRTVTMIGAWDENRAVDTLAVHFCSTRCKDKYISSLFDRGPEGEIVEEETVELLPRVRRQKVGQGRGARARKKKRAA